MRRPPASPAVPSPGAVIRLPAASTAPRVIVLGVVLCTTAGNVEPSGPITSTRWPGTAQSQVNVEATDMVVPMLSATINPSSNGSATRNAEPAAAARINALL